MPQAFSESSIHVQSVATNTLVPNSRNARTHSKHQIRQIADSIKAFGFVVPILIDENRTILAGHGRHTAAQLLSLQTVPVVTVDGLSPAKKRALLLADNKIAENAGWDRELLAAEIPELSEILIAENLDISIAGFVPAEIDALSADMEKDSSDPADEIDEKWLTTNTVSKPGDLWLLGQHRLLCGDAREPESLTQPRPFRVNVTPKCAQMRSHNKLRSASACRS